MVDVYSIRTKLGLSQVDFCKDFGLSLSTVRQWEQGSRTPRDSALSLLKVINHNPQLVKDVVKSIT